MSKKRSRRKRWSVSFVDACNCCRYKFRYSTRLEARQAQKRLKRPLVDYWGKVTKLYRRVGPVRG